MEVILAFWSFGKKVLSILHECGGDPNIGGLFGGSDKVFSTSVEVILD